MAHILQLRTLLPLVWHSFRQSKVILNFTAMLWMAILLGPSTAWGQSLSDLSAKYNACRKSAIVKYKSQGSKRVRTAVNSCRMLYPGAYLYGRCMKKRRSFKSNEPEMACLKGFEQTLMKSGEGLPFFFIKDNLIFGGLGLEEKFYAKDILSMNHLECSSLKKLLNDNDPSEFTFFGNNPQIFGSYEREKWLTRVASVATDGLENGVLLPGLGKIYSSLTDLQANLYVPHGSCGLKNMRNDQLTSLKWYFIRDGEHVIPYAGLANYKLGVIKKVGKLVRNAAKRLAKANASSKPRKISSRSKGVTILAAKTPPAWSASGEPKDFCREASDIGYVVLVREDAKSKSVASVMTINLPMMCDGFNRNLATWLR